jgi:hypothetical protein
MGRRIPICGDLIGFLLAISITGYIQYRSIRDLRSELIQTGRTRRIRGYLVGVTGLVLFFGLLQAMIFLAIFGIAEFRGEGLLFLTIITVILAGFLVGNRQIGKIRKKRRKTAKDTLDEHKHS